MEYWSLNGLTGRQWLAHQRESKGPSSGAAMNAILLFPTKLAEELQQLRSDVESHRQAIEVDAMAFEQSRAAWGSQEQEMSRRMFAMRLRLANLLA